MSESELEGKMSRKRKLDGSENHQEKRAKSSNEDGDPDNSEIRVSVGLLLRSDVVGKLIGKGGKNINSIRSESGASVNIHKQVQDSPERTAEVSGESASVVKALEMIAQKISEPEEDVPPVNMPLSITMLVESLNIGCVIGKKGAKISKIRQDSQARVQIGSQCMGESTQKTIEVSGTVEEVPKALRQLVKYLEDAHQPVRIPYEPASHNASRFDFGIARSYPNGPRPRAGNAPHGGSPRSAPGGFPAQFFPPPSVFHANQIRSTQPLNHAGFPGMNMAGSGVVGASPGDQNSPGHPAMSNMNPEHVQERIMNVPDSSMGRIIGKGGTRIQDIRIRSGAKIHISSAATGSTERKITITGQNSSVDVAVSMLQQLSDGMFLPGTDDQLQGFGAKGQAQGEHRYI